MRLSQFRAGTDPGSRIRSSTNPTVDDLPILCSDQHTTYLPRNLLLMTTARERNSCYNYTDHFKYYGTLPCLLNIYSKSCHDYSISWELISGKQAEEEEDPVCAYPQMTEDCKKECTAPFSNYQVADIRSTELSVSQTIYHSLFFSWW